MCIRDRYIIDDEIAYMGSLNFTSSSFKNNYETRIRTEDLGAIEKINDEFYELKHNDEIPRINIQKWGKSLYSEPIN